MQKESKVKKGRVKHYCTNCKHVTFYTWKDYLTKTIDSFLIMLGIVLLLFIVLIGPATVFNSLTSGVLIYASNSDIDELRMIAINQTSNCVDELSTYSYCYATNLYVFLRDTRYVPDNHFKLMSNPLMTLHYGGDCKHSSILFSTLMKSVGMESRVECSIKHGHCVSVVPHIHEGRLYDGFLVVDLTIPGVFLMNKGDDVWSYMNKTKIVS